MPTYNQLLKGIRKPKKYKSFVPALENCPYKKATCLRVYTTKPKKPNSAIRKIARVRLSNNVKIIVAIPGIGHELQEHSTVIVRGGRANDLPGVRYKLVRGLLDFTKLERIKRTHKRSKYGVVKNKK